LPDLSIASPPARPELIRQLRVRLDAVIPGLRVVAEALLGEDGPIDFVGIDAAGGAALVLVGAEGDDLELVARGLAERAWVEPRLKDWLQLAPNLGLRPEAGVGVVLCCPSFGPASRAAARALGRLAPVLATYRCVRNGSGVEPLVELLEGPTAPARAGEAAGAAAFPSFRTGLTDADLDLSAAERDEFA